MTESAPPEDTATRTIARPERRSGALSVQLSNLVVQVYRAHTGRGPTRSRTLIADNMLVVELRDTLTTGEKTLLAAGREHVVRELRTAYQQSMREALIAGVERLTGRRVQALLGDTHFAPDIAVAVFVLAPVSQATALA